MINKIQLENRRYIFAKPLAITNVLSCMIMALDMMNLVFRFAIYDPKASNLWLEVQIFTPLATLNTDHTRNILDYMMSDDDVR